MWAQKIHGLMAQLLNQQGARVDENAVRQVGDVDEAICSLESGESVFGSYSAVLVIRGGDKLLLQHQADMACRAIESLGFGARVETINATDAFIGSLPGETRANLRRPMISSQMLSCLLPAGRSFQGQRLSPNPLYGANAPALLQGRTLTGENFLLNLHVGDLGNAVVAGPPGSGKSVLLGELIIGLLRYKGMRVFAFDKDRGLSRLCRHYAGVHISFDGRGSLLCPLHDLKGDEGMDFARDYIELLCRVSNVSLSTQMAADAAAAIRAIAPLGDHSLSALYDLTTSLTLKEVIKPYLNAKGESSLLDGRGNPDLSAALTVFECADLFARSPRIVLPVLKAVFRMLQAAFDGRPAAVVVDEAWLMLKDEVFAAELLKWFKTLRKFNVLVILATQSVTDFSRSAIFPDLLDCAKTRIFLPNPDANSEQHQPIYRQFGLSEAQVEQIRKGTPKHDYFLSNPSTFQGFCLAATPMELELLRPEIREETP